MASKNGNAVGLTSILDRRRFVLLAADVLDYKTVAGGGPDDGRRRILLRRRRRRRGAAFRRRRRRVRFDSIAKCRRPGRREVLVEVAAVRAGAAERAEGVAGGVAVRREHLPGRRQSAVGRRCQSRRRGRGESAGTLFTLIMLVVVGVVKSAGVRLQRIVFTRGRQSTTRCGLCQQYQQCSTSQNSQATRITTWGTGGGHRREQVPPSAPCEGTHVLT